MEEEFLKLFLVAIIFVVIVIWIQRCSGDNVRVNSSKKSSRPMIMFFRNYV